MNTINEFWWLWLWLWLWTSRNILQYRWDVTAGKAALQNAVREVLEEDLVNRLGVSSGVGSSSSVLRAFGKLRFSIFYDVTSTHAEHPIAAKSGIRFTTPNTFDSLLWVASTVLLIITTIF